MIVRMRREIFQRTKFLYFRTNYLISNNWYTEALFARKHGELFKREGKSFILTPSSRTGTVLFVSL